MYLQGPIYPPNDVLRDEDLPGLVLPELGQRISFTAFDPAKQGSSVGAVLYSESFYIAKPIHFSKWPDSCGNMSVGNPTLQCICIMTVLQSTWPAH